MPAPMTVGRILDRIWVILRGRVWLFTAIGAVPGVATLILIGAIFGALFAMGIFPPHPQAPASPQFVWKFFTAILLAMAPMMLVYAVFHAAVCHASIAVSRGAEVTWRSAYSAAWNKTGRYIWLVVLCWLIVSAPLMLAFALVGGMAALSMFHAGGAANPAAFLVILPILLLLYLGGMVYGIWMTLRVGLAFPAAVAEDLTAAQAVARSARLTHRAKGRMFLVLLVVYAISYAVMLVIEMLGMAGFAIVALIGSSLHWNALVGFVGLGILAVPAFLVFMAMMSAIYGIVFSVLYEDQVVRIDGGAQALIAGGERG
jgi:membrane-anchored glycerophosphoryl diester phosphodiesterase (GDPDase)